MKYVALLKELKSFLRNNDLEESIAHIIIEDFLGSTYHIFLDDEVKQKAKLKFSFSDMTFPHTLARVMLVEQLYRAFTISVDGKYHK